MQLMTKIKIYRVETDLLKTDKYERSREECIYEQVIEGFDKSKIQALVATFNDIKRDVTSGK